MTHILFLHGWGAGSASFAPVRTFFERVAPCIFPEFDCNPDKVLTLEDYVEQIEQILIDRNVTSVNIIAHSFGARVAVLLAKRNPHMVGRMVLTGAAGLRPRFSFRRYIKIRAYKIVKKFGGGKGWGSSDYKKLSPTGRATFRNIVNRDLAPEIRKIAHPTFLIFGTRDRQTPPYMAKKYARLLKNTTNNAPSGSPTTPAPLKMYDGAGHYCFVDEPARFIHDAYAFLSGGGA